MHTLCVLDCRMVEEVRQTGKTMEAVVGRGKREREESGGLTCPAEKGRERVKATIRGGDRMPPIRSGDTHLTIHFCFSQEK